MNKISQLGTTWRFLYNGLSGACLLKWLASVHYCKYTMHIQKLIFKHINIDKPWQHHNISISNTSIIADKKLWPRIFTVYLSFAFFLQLFQKRTSWNEQCKVQVFADCLPFLSPNHQCPALKETQSTQPNHKNWPRSSFIYHLTSDGGERQS